MPRLLSIAGIILAYAALFATAALAQPIVLNNCEAREDADGDCISDLVDVEVTVSGIVIAWQEFGVRGPAAIWDPASGCCISVFDIDLYPALPLGSLVEVTGWVGNFAGLDEIVDNPADGAMDPVVVVTGSGALPTPTPIVGADLADGSALAEGLESCLVTLCGTFAAADGAATFNTFSSNYDFVAQDGNTVVVRVDGDTDIGGSVIPTGDVNVVAIMGQFDGFGANLCGGYQLLPRSLADLNPTADCGPVATDQQSWGEVKSRFDD